MTQNQSNKNRRKLLKSKQTQLSQKAAKKALKTV